MQPALRGGAGCLRAASSSVRFGSPIRPRRSTTVSTATASRSPASALIVLAAAACVGLLLARSFSRPLRRLEAVAARVGGGDLDSARIGTRRAAGDPPPRRRAEPHDGEARRTADGAGAVRRRCIARVAHAADGAPAAARERGYGRRAARGRAPRAARRRTARAGPRRRAAARPRTSSTWERSSARGSSSGSPRRPSRASHCGGRVPAASFTQVRRESSRFSTTCSRTRSMRLRATETSGRRARHRVARHRRGPGLTTSSARARSTVSGVRARARIGARASRSRSGWSSSTAARSSWPGRGRRHRRRRAIPPRP